MTMKKLLAVAVFTVALVLSSGAGAEPRMWSTSCRMR